MTAENSRCIAPEFTIKTQATFALSGVLENGLFGDSALSHNAFQPGDLVIYTVSKQGLHPGPGARDIQPVPNGEDYTYVVDKYWMVQQLSDGGRVIIVTRRGKTREVSAGDPLLRKATWWQRLRYRDRFPSVEVRTEKTAD